MKLAASVAAAGVIFAGICYTNPVLAAKIPLIGKIFEKVQQETMFPGDYSQKAEILNSENEDGTENTKKEYTVEDSGLTFTASEIYCDGMSVFLTAEVQSEQGGFQNMPGGCLYLDGNWKLTADAEEKMLMNNNLYGQVIDDNTFIGMLKLDLDNKDLQSGTVELKLSMMGYDDVNELDAEDISAFHKIQGEWNLNIPFTVDTKAAKTIPINQEKDGYCLKNVIVSPYQVITYTDVPYTEKEITREEYESVMKEKTGKTEDFGITYEEYVEQMSRTYAESYTIVFDQDGQKLVTTEEARGKAVQAVENRDISKLYIYIFDDFDAWAEMYENGMDSDAANRALISAEVNVK